MTRLAQSVLGGGCAVVAVAFVLAICGSEVLAQEANVPVKPGSGGQEDSLVCTGEPAPCLGATVHIPGGTAGATLGRGDCLGGRIVTPDTGGQSDGIPYCPDVDGDGVSDPPPSHAQIVAAICPDRMVPTPVLATSPEERGFTGLETWFWSAGRHDLTTSGTVSGYAVGCRVTASNFTIDTGDIHAEEFGTQRRQSSAQPGHEGPDTPIRHLYERWGTYDQSLTITWQRTTSNGSDSTSTSTTRPWQVVSVVTGAAPTN